MLKTWKALLEAAGDVSLNERMQAVSRAVSQKFNQGPGEYCYVELVFEAYAVICKGNKLWRIPYTVADDGTVTIADDAPVQVRMTPTAVNEGVVFGLMPDTDATVTEGEEAPAPTGKRWGVLIIQEGLSKNRNRYARKVLQDAAPLYEGARIYMDHQEEQRRYGRSTKDLAGFLKNVQPVLLNEAAGTTKEAVARFALAAEAIITKQWVRQEMLDAYQEGNANLFGLSHDVRAESTTVMSEGGAYYDVTRIDAVSSVDLVTNPAAGGRVLRLVASDTVPHTLEKDGQMLQKMIEAIKASGNQGLIAQLTALGATPNEDQVLGLYSEALKAPAAPAPAAKPTTEAVVPAPAPAAQATSQITEAQFLESRQDALQYFLENAINGTSLHQPVKDSLKAKLGARIGGAKSLAELPTKLLIEAEIKEQVDLFAKLAEGNIVMPATGRPRVEIVKDRRDKVVEAFDDFFGIKREGEKVSLKAQPAMMSFRQLYADITGDRNVTGLVKEATLLRESMDSTTFDQILGDSITRRMVAEYQQAPQAMWRGIIADVVPVTDFRTQRRMRFGGYGNLSTVSQGAPYASMTSPTDEEATYSPAKRGGTEQITIEMIANDDVGVIRRIPTKMARAASQTLYEFVLDFMRTNAAVYDSTALAAAGHGNNISTTALSATQVSALRLAIKNQTDMSSGKKLGLAGRYLWVPNELEELAFQITGADRAVPDSSLAGSAAPAAPNFIRAQGIRPIVVDYWTDTNNYWLTADISQTPMIEIGFWGGEEPSLFVQDNPSAGSLFSNDAITYKIRHVYGGAVLDYRGFAGGIVA
jgi:hypothetical protein